MKFIELIVALVGHLAWPVAIVVIIRSFKRELTSLISRIKKASYKGIEIDLEKEFQEVKKEAEDLGITINRGDPFSDESFRTYDEAPEWAFIKSWQETESLVLSAVSTLRQGRLRTSDFNEALSALVGANIINNDMASLIGKLREIRNKIVHGGESTVTRGEALEWLGISKSIRQRLQQAIELGTRNIELGRQ